MTAIETIRLAMMARGDTDYVTRIQRKLREQEVAGDIRIVFMDDEVAKIQCLNPAWVRVMRDAEGVAP